MIDEPDDYIDTQEDEDYYEPIHFEIGQVEGELGGLYESDRQALIDSLHTEIQPLVDAVVNTGSGLDDRIRKSYTDQLVNPEEYFNSESSPYQFSRLLHSLDTAVVALSQKDDVQDLQKIDDYHILTDIATNGMYNGSTIDLEIPEEFADFQQYTNRAFLVQLFVKNREMFDSLVDMGIIGAHASSGSSLLGVLKHGLKPQDFLAEQAHAIGLGTFDQGSLTEGINHKNTSHFYYYKGHWVYDYLPEEGQYIDRESIQSQIDKLRQKDIQKFDVRAMKWTSTPVDMSGTIRSLEDTLRIIDAPKDNIETCYRELLMDNIPVVYLSPFADVNGKMHKVGELRSADDFIVDGGTTKASDAILVPSVYVDRVKFLAGLLDNNAKVFPLETYLEVSTIVGPYQ